MMNDLVSLMIALVAGMALGAVAFGGLWWTVRRLPTAKSPALLTVGSLVARLGISILGFYLIGAGSWERLLASLAGYILVRQVLIRRAQLSISETMPAQLS
jgi:F1F0 ATPase subunit 2